MINYMTNHVLFFMLQCIHKFFIRRTVTYNDYSALIV